MFRWYRDAAKCYVYLDKVSSAVLEQNIKVFHKSRWFTRGWTLQELLAPKSVESFSVEGNPLGSKSSRLHKIAETTCMPIEALQERALSYFTVDEQMAWAKGRLDLFAIKKSKTGSNSTEVHALSGASKFQTYILHVDTGLHETGASFTFALADWNGDRRPDLVAIKKSDTSSVHTEMYVLSGASLFKKFILRAETPLYKTMGMFQFALLVDWRHNGRPDLVAIQQQETRSDTTEVVVSLFLKQ
jgi:hypothetical protein